MKRNLPTFVQYLFFFTAVVLMALGVGSMFRVGVRADMDFIRMFYAILMLGDALAMLACGLFIKARKPAIFWAAVTLLSLNIVLTIFDQFGLVDLLFVLLNLLMLGLLIALRREFLPQ
ncbi:MAG: hypothetical protein HY865_18285 [Chloroflexi bacterium]|nr:hypothetical protein [Chloroflexota bacterium]